MKSMLRVILEGDLEYQALMLFCPGCEELGSSGLHMIPVGGNVGNKPRWEWNGQKDVPTLTPSIRARLGSDMREVCHSHLIDGVWRYLPDSTHSLAGTNVPLPNLPDWVTNL